MTMTIDFGGSGGAISVTQSGETTSPLLISATGDRKFQNGLGQPFLLKGVAAWSLTVQLDQTDAEAFIADQASRGYNAVLFTCMEHLYGSNDPVWRNENGDLPFTTTLGGGEFDMTTPNEAYWAHLDFLIDTCAAYGMVAIVSATYLGFNTNEGWEPMLQANGSVGVESYGTFLGNRYKDKPNVMWLGVAADRPVANLQAGTMGLLQDMIGAIQTADTNHIVSALFWWGIGGQSYDSEGPWQDYSFLYSSGGGMDDAVALDAWANFTGPYICGEASYRGSPWGLENPLTRAFMRAQAIRTLLSGSTGAIYGDERVWHFDTPVPPAYVEGTSYTENLDTLESADFIRICDFFIARDWHLLEPSTGTGLVTSGGGTLGTTGYKPRALASDGSWGAVYVYDGTTVTVNESLVNGGAINAFWWDPSDGHTEPANGSSGVYVASSDVGTNSAGDDDWILILEADT